MKAPAERRDGDAVSLPWHRHRTLLTPASHAASLQSVPLRSRSVPGRVPAHPCWWETLGENSGLTAPPAGLSALMPFVGQPGGTGWGAGLPHFLEEKRK